jgi:uncharacterized protein (TIGR02001 family)
MKFTKSLGLSVGASVLALGLMTGAAQAQVTFSGNVGFYSDYRLRGVSQTDGNLAIQGAIEASIPLSDSVTLFGGVWDSSLDKDVGFGGLETDVYAGLKGKAGDLGWSAKYIRLIYVDQDDVDFDQYAAEITYPIGPIGASLGIVYDEYNGGGDSTYIYGGGSYSFKEMPISVRAQLGYEDGSFYNEKWNWNIGATYTYKQVSFSLDYIDTDQEVYFTGLADDQADSTVVAAITAAF